MKGMMLVSLISAILPFYTLVHQKNYEIEDEIHQPISKNRAEAFWKVL